MKVCVLQPDYSTSDVDYKNYDPPRNLAPLLPADDVVHIFLNKLTTYKQLKQLSKLNFDIFVNLCEGYLDWSVPSIDVIHCLDLLNLPYTGPNALLYDPPKTLMKYVSYCSGIKTPEYVLVHDTDSIKSKINNLSFPLFIKPAKAGDSIGIDKKSLVHNESQLQEKVNSLLLADFDDILIETYIPGREFTVLVAANPDKQSTCSVFKPIEYVFPDEQKFKTYALKTSELHSDVYKPCYDLDLENNLKSAAEKIFNGFAAVGYARLDFRVSPGNEIYFLEINFTCSVFYDSGFEGSADYILKIDPIGGSGFLKHIINEGILRHAAKQKKFEVKGNSINGYGIFANKNISKEEVIFNLECSPIRIATKRFIEKNWNDQQKEDFRHYAYPLSNQVYILWDDDPNKWAPQNHSCNPNTKYDGLNLVASSHIQKNEELTLDYSSILDENITPFPCNCGGANCRKIIKGKKGNSITNQELNQ